jgi:hypothetical protein
LKNIKEFTTLRWKIKTNGVVKMTKTFFFLLLSLLLTTNLPAQSTGSLYGTVISADNKEPLVAANIVILDTQLGTSTDQVGKYRIDNIPVGTYRLRFDYIGFQPVFKTDVVIKSANPAVVNVEMEERILEGEEVRVTAGYFVEEEGVQPSTIGLSREEIRRFPGGFEDVVRTVSTLPGVAINSAGGRNDLLVRGGGPSENLYVINNIQVPNINHFGTQGNSSGSLSFVNLDFVDDVKFSTGGFAARYGDKMSSVLSLTMLEKNPDSFESKLTLSATQYGLDFETPVTENGSLIISARKSYLDLIFKAANLPFIPVYTDYNVLFHYDLSPNDKLFLLGLSAVNNVDRDQSTLENRVTNAGLLDNSQYQGIAGLNYRRSMPHGYLDLTLNSHLFRYRFKQLDENEEVWFKSDADEREYGIKLQHYWIISKYFGLRNGVSVRRIENENTTAFADSVFDRNGNKLPVQALGVPKQTQTDMKTQKYAAFAELDIYPHPNLDINLGVRADYYAFLNRSLYPAPRLSLRYKLHPLHSLRLSGGRYYQSPSYVWVTNPANRSLRALQNNMIVAGWDYLIREDIRMSLEVYRKWYRDLPTGTIPGVSEYIVLTNTGTGFGGREDDFQSFGYFDLVSEAEGRSYGAELLLQKKFSDIPLYGLVSFTLNKSEVIAGNGLTYPGQYDQRFILNLSGGYIFNEKWEIAAKFRYFTGVPFTPVYRPEDNPLGPGEIQNLPAEYLAGRTAAGHHLDIRVDRTFNFSSTTLIAYIDIQNIYNYKIPQRPRYDFWDNSISTSSDIGILPSIGVSYEF